MTIKDTMMTHSDTPPHGTDLHVQALNQPDTAISYFFSHELARIFPSKAILETEGGSFDLYEYAQGGQCVVKKKDPIHAQIMTRWNGIGYPLEEKAVNAWFEVSWQGHSLEVIQIQWVQGDIYQTLCGIVAETREIVTTFFRTVCDWCSEVRGQVLVFENGCWEKSEALFQAIRGATFENLILAGTLKDELKSDLAQFFASREVYERYGVPWKRGLLFIGPPGNGKTHTVKALINWLGQPCLYVKSFRSRYGVPDQSNIHQVFLRARQTTPCMLVLEDLDSLVDEKNRSYFLNELDGFAANTGIVVVATTNHPERLDPAILDRPSRFDRKYPFSLPEAAERRDYLRLWNDALQSELRLSEAGIERTVAQTEGFSFAYLKELVLSSMMRWIDAPQQSRQHGVMDSLMTAQVDTLRMQMSSMNEEPPSDAISDDEEEE